MKRGHDGSIDDEVGGVIMNAFLWGDVVKNALQRSNFGTIMAKRKERFERLEAEFVKIFIGPSSSFISSHC